MSRFVSDIIRASQHHWSNILSSLAIPIPHLNKHGPCPVCGGKDRFRFDDKKGEERGSATIAGTAMVWIWSLWCDNVM